jgi:hypothetical protein
MKMHHNASASEGNQSLSIHTVKTRGTNNAIILIHEGLMDDSQEAIQIKMKPYFNGKIWHVLEVRKNWKYHENRGHNSWGTESCN